MYKICKTEQSALRQKRIEDGLLMLMEKQRYEDITVSDLCMALEIPRKAFYRYFSSKEDALMALIDHRLLEYGDHDTSAQPFGVDMHWFFEFWLLQKPLLDALGRSGLSGILVERAISNSQEAMLFDMPGQSREYVKAVTAFGVCGMMSMALRWHQDGYRQSVEEMAAMAWRLLSRPLMPGME